MLECSIPIDHVPRLLVCAIWMLQDQKDIVHTLVYTQSFLLLKLEITSDDGCRTGHSGLYVSHIQAEIDVQYTNYQPRASQRLVMLTRGPGKSV